MKHLSRRMKKVAPLALLGLLMLDRSPVNQSAQALVGGPFDDNAYFGSSSADGTYSGTLTGSNLIGMVSFGVSSNSEGNGRFAVFHEGFVQYGTAAGMADLASRRISGSLLGVAALPGETTGGSGSPASSGQALTVRSGAEGAFQARMKGYPQQITFEGEGKLSTNANTAVLTATNDPNINPNVTVFISGVPVAAVADGDPFGATADVQIDAGTQRAILRSSTSFKIRGSRTSRQLYSALNSYSSIAPLTLTSSGSIATPTPAPTPPPAP
jgi:hypothetical protein